MKRLFNIYTILTFLLILTTNIFAQRAKIYVEPMSPGKLTGLGWSSNVSSGLTNVGRGTVVYLSAKEVAGAAVTAATWELLSKPATSSTVLDSTTTLFTTFRPDTTGSYQIKLTITTATGTANTTKTFYAQKYAGVGGVGGVPPDFSKGQCAGCHANYANTWATTLHAGALKLGVDGVHGAHFGKSCLKCHTTGYDAGTSTNNLGFDDIAADLGWIFPTTLQPGNFDSLVTHYPTLAQLGVVGCESCHGPGNTHYGDTNKIAKAIDVGVCAQCHDSKPYEPLVEQWKNSGHGNLHYTSGFRQTSSNVNYNTNNMDNCVRCHDGRGFINYTDNHTTPTDSLYVYNQNQLSCTVCHDPHNTNGLEHQLRKVAVDTLYNGYKIPNTFGMGGLCMNCHKNRRNGATYPLVTRMSSGFGPHENPQTDMYLGKNAYEWGTTIPRGGGHLIVEDACVGCHMAANTDTAAANHIGGHTWMMSYTDGQGHDHDNVTKCQTCHVGITKFDDIKALDDFDGDGTVEGFLSELEGLRIAVAKALPPFGLDSINTTMMAQSPDSAIFKKVYYNYLFVQRGIGLHNPDYAVNLYKTSLQMLKYYFAANQIGDVLDVANDQGKQVQVLWYKFPGELLTDTPVKFYGIWRLDPSAGKTTKINVKSFDNLTPFLSTLQKGGQVTVSNDVWTFVGWTPVSGMDLYSINVPTLADSTIENGMHLTMFKVSGHKSDYTPIAWSNVDSGYSIDNLAPAALGGFTANLTGPSVKLEWNQTTDTDVNYYAIYRGTEENFDYQNQPPLTTSTTTEFVDQTVEQGIHYYYVLRAVDFSGNKGAISKVNLVVLGVNDGNALPKVFALHQNYPNPFNPSTTIHFDIPKNANVKIEIFDIYGRLITTLANKEFTAGTYSILWEGTDLNNQKVSSGIYMYRMATDGFVATKKLIMIK